VTSLIPATPDRRAPAVGRLADGGFA
jgi:hypothetical protein